jgi:hypothetical protein
MLYGQGVAWSAQTDLKATVRWRAIPPHFYVSGNGVAGAICIFEGKLLKRSPLFTRPEGRGVVVFSVASPISVALG